MDLKNHWEEVYSTKVPEAVSWFQEQADTSLHFLNQLKINKSAAIIDVGGGASTLIDDLLLQGYNNVSVLDVSRAALQLSKKRLDAASASVTWLVDDITQMQFAQHEFEVWHDRAVFHFLTEKEDRAAYIENVLHALATAGHIIIATFAEDGPEQCSGLPVARYSARSLAAEFGDRFLLKSALKQTHKTPFGTSQNFIYCHLVKNA